MALKDKAARKAYEVARYAKNREEIIARTTAYAAANKERVRETAKARYRRDPKKVLDEVARWRKANPEKVKKTQREAQRKHQYGITADQVAGLLAAQGGVCAIRGCMVPLSMVGSRGGDVDHDHITGAVRGLLCHACNVGLGQFRDDPSKLIAAAEYLRRQPPILLGGPPCSSDEK